MFKNGDVICLLGDSITANGIWGAEVYQVVGATCDARFYNCGVSGSTATNAAQYLYSMCLSKNPDKVAVMFGVNDIDRGALSASYTGTDGRERVAAAVARYGEKMEYIVKSIKDFGADPILCTAPPYDEYNESESENLGCDYALAECADIVHALAKKYDCHLVDFRREMLSIIRERRPIGSDRVHPNAKGYHIMAQIFLRECGIIPECDYDTPFELEEWNAKRREAEVKLKQLDYIEYNRYFGKIRNEGWGVPEIKDACRTVVETSTTATPFIMNCCGFYLDNASHRDEIYNELVKLTVYPRNAKKRT